MDWDAPIPEPNKTKWLKYLFKLKQLNSVSIPRYIVGSEYVTMHGFCDSSKEAYCAVVYLQARNKDGIQSGIIASKTKVAPLKELSIPRLELLGCLMLATLADSICKALDGVLTIQRKCFWSDSKISLCWIKNKSKEWKPWVENRVNKIRDLSEKDDWYFVPGGINPADIATREIDILSFCDNTSWWKGPEYILHDESTWPDQGQAEPSILDEINTEMRVVQTNVVVTDTSAIENIEDNKSFTGVALHNIIDINRFSSLSKTFRVTSYMLRFIHNITHSNQSRSGELSIAETETSEKLWVRSEQNIIKIKKNYANLRKQLGLFTADGILKLKGRFGNSNLKHEFKHPNLLDSDSYFTRLVVSDAHENVKHLRTNSTLNEIR